MKMTAFHGWINEIKESREVVCNAALYGVGLTCYCLIFTREYYRLFGKTHTSFHPSFRCFDQYISRSLLLRCLNFMDTHNVKTDGCLLGAPI